MRHQHLYVDENLILLHSAVAIELKAQKPVAKCPIVCSEDSQGDPQRGSQRWNKTFTPTQGGLPLAPVSSPSEYHREDRGLLAEFTDKLASIQCGNGRLYHN